MHGDDHAPAPARLSRDRQAQRTQARRWVELPGNRQAMLDPDVICRVSVETIDNGSPAVAISTTEGFTILVFPSPEQSVAELYEVIRGLLLGGA